MKVYITPSYTNSWALKRVVTALVRYVPYNAKIVANQNAADLVVLHVIGRQDRNRARAEHLRTRGQRYVVIQYCVRSTLRPSTQGWLPLWQGSVLTWSYYDLMALCAEDGTSQDFPFYHAPLGADAAVFYPRQHQRQYIIGTSGYSWVTESVREAGHAAQRTGHLMFHLGHRLNKRSHIVYASGIDDDALAHLLSQCQFVAGLRRTEGFELMAAEGLLCGARPICFNRSHYKQWFAPWAIFIPERSREQVINNLETIFHSGARPVMRAERDAAKICFDWKTIIGGFWNKVRHG